ncbi:hypothetical protein [Candidatus Enterovibrio altilux]|uniref:hypothetical protein n=1 Tax=Candidatus Enterovibrio altilux TaxID=1927128 RepID=UPI000BBBD878|nr:hypothetical protein [Candidatus Enterovibrio luxaltus]
MARYRDYQSKGTKQFHAHVQVNPISLVEVKIIEKDQCHISEFKHLHFEQSGYVTNLVSNHTSNSKLVQWQLPLASDDARELQNLIEEATEELEILIRSL